MKKTLQVLNKLVAQGVVNDYAIGGAMGAMFYTEAFATMDLDVFVLFPDETDLLPLAPVYARLREWGYFPDEHERECINIEGTPVQFLPAYDDLLQEALACSQPFEYEGVETKVMLPEYLAVIAARTGRTKDKLRVQMLLEGDKCDKEKYEQLLSKFLPSKGDLK